MADEILKRDQNHVTVLAGITNDSDEEIKMLRVDPITKRLLVAATGGGGAVSSVSNSDGTLTITPTTGAVVASIATAYKIPVVRTISTTSPLSGGGDLSANRTITTSMATNKLIGRGTVGTGVMEEITLGTNISLTGTTLNVPTMTTLPGGGENAIQVNRSSAFYGDETIFKLTTSKEVVITGNASTFVADTANVMVSLEYDAGYAYDNTMKYDVNARIYPYRIVGGIKYFSVMYAEGTTVTADQSSIPFRSVMSWDAVTGADGYRVVLLNASTPVSPGTPPYAPFNYDYYVDVVTNSLVDNNDQTYVPFVDGVDNVPIGAANATNNLQVLGRSYFNQTAQHAARVVIDTTGSLTEGTEALHVVQNAEIDGVLGVAGATDANTFINVSKSIPLVDGVDNRGLNITMTGAPVADTTGSMTGLNINLTGGTSHTNGGLTGQIINVSDSSNSTGAIVGSNIAVSSAGNTSSASQMFGVFMAGSKASAGNMSTLDGARITVNVGAGGNISDGTGGEFIFQQNSNNNVANITNARGGFFHLALGGEGATTDGAASYARVTLAKGGSVVGTASTISIFKGDLSVSGGFAPTILNGLYLPNITGGVTNYSIYSAGGKAHIEGAIEQGSSQQLTIDASGNITKINNVATSFPASQGSADRYYRNDGSGNITWVQVSLTAGVTGTLPRGNGGTGQTTSSIKFTYTTDANNGTTAETDLYSSTLATGQLGTNGDIIESQYGGIITSVATSTQQLKVYFGGTVIFDSGALNIGVSTTYWNIYTTIIRVSSSVVRCSVTLTTSFASLSAYTAYTEVTGLTLSNTQILKITGTAGGVAGGSNQITAKEGYIEYKSIT